MIFEKLKKIVDRTLSNFEFRLFWESSEMILAESIEIFVREVLRQDNEFSLISLLPRKPDHSTFATDGPSSSPAHELSRMLKVWLREIMDLSVRLATIVMMIFLQSGRDTVAADLNGKTQFAIHCYSIAHV